MSTANFRAFALLSEVYKFRARDKLLKIQQSLSIASNTSKLDFQVRMNTDNILCTIQNKYLKNVNIKGHFCSLCVRHPGLLRVLHTHLAQQGHFAPTAPSSWDAYPPGLCLAGSILSFRLPHWRVFP